MQQTRYGLMLLSTYTRITFSVLNLTNTLHSYINSLVSNTVTRTMRTLYLLVGLLSDAVQELRTQRRTQQMLRYAKHDDARAYLNVDILFVRMSSIGDTLSHARRTYT